MPPVFRVGLTGGIGSGKSTISRMFASHGACIIDADLISRELTLAGGQAIPWIIDTFGPSFVDAGGALERDKMRSLIYSDVVARSKLEAIIHPMVRRAIQLQADRAIEENFKVVLYDIPLLLESSLWREQMDHLLVVDATPEVQIERVMVRSSMTAIQVEKIIASQTSRVHRLRAADTVIFNSTISLSQLASDVQYTARCFGLSCPSSLKQIN